VTDLVLLSERLRERLPAAALSFDPGPEYVVDDLMPGLVALPKTQEEVAAVLAVANEAGAAVIPWGAGGRMSIGMPPERYDLALDLRGLNRVVEYEPADLTVTVEAGVELDDLRRLLGEHGQWLPIDPQRGPHATIGGLLATNASGASRHRYGTFRDWVIGMMVALPDGALVKSGGRVVKNVAGYDLAKLHIGALGTLGVIVQASFKVAPLPAHAAIGAVGGSLPTLMSITARLSDALLAIDSFLLAKDAASDAWELRLRFAGSTGAVERSQREFAALAPNAAIDVYTEKGHTLTPLRDLTSTLRVRASATASEADSLFEALAEAGAAVDACPTAGVAHGRWAESLPAAETLRELRTRCETAGGALILERAPVDLKRAVGVWGEPRGDFALMRRLKQQFDPNRILNPGRFVGGI
jgi:glycolate oxidase FAD binding subunit